MVGSLSHTFNQEYCKTRLALWHQLPGLPSWGTGSVVPGREVHISPPAIQVHMCRSHPGCCRLRHGGTGMLSYSQSPRCHWDSWWSSPPRASLSRQEHQSTWGNKGSREFRWAFPSRYPFKNILGRHSSVAPAQRALALPCKASIRNEQKRPNSMCAVWSVTGCQHWEALLGSLGEGHAVGTP